MKSGDLPLEMFYQRDSIFEDLNRHFDQLSPSANFCFKRQYTDVSDQAKDLWELLCAFDEYLSLMYRMGGLGDEETRRMRKLLVTLKDEYALWSLEGGDVG